MSVGEIEIIDEGGGESEDFPVPSHLEADPDFAALSPARKVEVGRYYGWSINRIAMASGLTPKSVMAYSRHLDAAMFKQMAEEPDEVRAWHRKFLREITLNVMLDPESRRVPTRYRVALQAMADERKMMGLDAPERAVNVNLSARTVISPAQQQALIHDPEYRQHLLAIEELERRAAQGSGHVPGEVRRGGLEGEVEGDPAPADPQRPDAQGGDGPDRPADGVHAPEAWEVDVPEPLVPGLVSGHLPRSEGDLGQL